MLGLGGKKLAHQGGVLVEIGHPGDNAGETSRLVCPMNIPTDSQLEQLAHETGAALLRNHLMLVTAESCTGGWIAKTATGISGASEWFDCGMVTYSYEAKQALLGVRPETLEKHGAVSRECVAEMVAGALVHSGGSMAVAVTGIAGPGQWQFHHLPVR